MSQEFVEITQMINHLSQRDFVRLKIYINEKFEKMKSENPKKINNIVYAVKNPEKVKDSVNKYRRKTRVNNVDNVSNNLDNVSVDNKSPVFVD